MTELTMPTWTSPATTSCCSQPATQMSGMTSGFLTLAWHRSARQVSSRCLTSFQTRTVIQWPHMHALHTLLCFTQDFIHVSSLGQVLARYLQVQSTVTRQS